MSWLDRPGAYARRWLTLTMGDAVLENKSMGKRKTGHYLWWVTAAGNDGADAESFVAKVLRSRDWTVAFYTHRRGYGFDLWARKGNSAMMIEVKSSLGDLGAVSLTTTEYRAACEYTDNYVLALVDQLNSDTPRLRMIQNPAESLEIEERTTTSYVITRAEWQRAVDEKP